MVGSQIASLTPGPSFAHNLGYRCPNDQCEAIFDIYASRTFQQHQEHPKFKVFWPLLSNSKHLGVSEDSKSPTLGVWGFTPTLGQSGVATYYAHLTSDEHYYLRMLLNYVKGATSYEHLRTVDGREHDTFKDACIAMGLLEDDNEWDQALEEAGVWALG